MSKSKTSELRQDLTSGEYTYNIRCVDDGGNLAETSTTFEVFVDTFPPEVVRVLYNSNNLHIITDEDASCRFTNDPNVQCNFNLEDLDGAGPSGRTDGHTYVNNQIEGSAGAEDSTDQVASNQNTEINFITF